MTARLLSFLYVATATATDVLRDIGKCAPIAVGVAGKLGAEARLTPELVCKSMLSVSMAVAIAHGVSEKDFLGYAGRMYRLMRASQEGGPTEVERVLADMTEPPAEDAPAGDSGSLG